MLRKSGLVILGLMLCASSVAAKGLSPYLPINLSPEIEQQINQLLAITDRVPLTRPYKANDILQRLRQVQTSHPLLYKRLNHYLTRFTQSASLTHAAVKISRDGGETKLLPNQRGISTASNYQLSLGAIGYLSPYAYFSGGALYSQDNGITHYATHMAVGYEYAQMEIGYREHWFSPFQDGAMLVSTHAQSSPSISISNATPITSWNFRYEMFYSMLEPVDEIVLGDESHPGRPRHAGLHLSFSPWDFWTIGLNRTLQFGGGKRKVTFNDVLEALFDPAGKDNVGDVDNDDPNFEFGNQQASVTSQWNFTLGMPISVYAEYGGEDTVNESNFSLGNEVKSLGVYLPFVTDSLSLRYEYVNWATRWYVHHLYPDGYSNEGVIMGHWAGGERLENTSPGASIHSLQMNWNIDSSRMLDLNVRTVEIDETAPLSEYERGIHASMRYSQATRYGLVGIELYAGKDVLGSSFSHLSAFYRW